jgi:hypothetical protein
MTQQGRSSVAAHLVSAPAPTPSLLWFALGAATAGAAFLLGAWFG